MGLTILKKYLGEAGAGLDNSHDPGPGVKKSRLLDVLSALCLGKPLINAHLAVIATGILARAVITGPDTLRELSCRIDVCGSAGNTVVQVRVNTVVITSLTIDNAAVDPTQVKISLPNVAGGTNTLGFDVKDGDIVDLNVSAAPTGGTGLTATLRSSPIDIES
jgi:hypothetical protein